MPDLPLSGRCLCGGVRFEVTEAPYLAGYCHCTRCQRRTGTGSAVSVRIPPGSLRILAGEELIGSFDPPDGAAKLFCTACGSALWSLRAGDPPLVSIRMAAFDGDPGVRPSYRQFVANAASWEPIPDDGLPRFDGRLPSVEALEGR
jgi:hypothetical protein